MSNDPFSGSSADIRAEACAWIAQLETGELTRADIDAFREWTQRSPRHAAEIRKLAHLSADLNVLTGMAGPMKTAAAKYAGVVKPRRKLNGKGLAWLSATAMAGVLAVTIVLAKLFPQSAEPHWPMVLTTGIGESLEHRLPDGSVLSLNTDTELEVSFTEDRRRIELRKGEALFTVARNPQRPFVVYAGGKSVEAVGTVFLVRNDKESFEVAVTEGRVKLETVTEVVAASDTAPAVDPGNTAIATAPTKATEHPAIEQPAPLLLDAGQHVTLQVQNTASIPPIPAIEAISPLDLRRKLAWRDGLLDFSDTPLMEVVREVSRYTTTEIEIADPSLAQVRFGGVFRAGDTEPLFRALESAYDIHAEYVDQDTVRLTRSRPQ